MQRPELWIVRHGETTWSRDGRHTSSTDLPLTAAGQNVARSLAPRLADVTFDLVLTSPLQRARSTASLAGFPDAEVTDDAREWAYGDYEGITTAQIRERTPDWSLWSDGAPGGEQPADVAARADRLVARVRTGARTRALVFAHGHILRVLAARWLGLPARQRSPPAPRHRDRVRAGVGARDARGGAVEHVRSWPISIMGVMKKASL